MAVIGFDRDLTNSGISPNIDTLRLRIGRKSPISTDFVGRYA